jgi:DNA-binding MarR family transcriptional regulator
MFKIFGDTFRELFLKFYFQSYLLMERSLRIRSKNNLTIREMLLLGFLERMKKNNNHTLMNVAKYLQVSPPVISSSVKSLMRKGYLIKVLNPEDNRIFFLELTEKAKLSNQRSFQFTERILGKSVGKMTLFDIKALKKSFQIVETVIDEENQLLDAEELKNNSQ